MTVPVASEHDACPRCGSHHVTRMYLNASQIDVCLCSACELAWDEPIDGEANVDASQAARLSA